MTTNEGGARRSLHLDPGEDDPVARVYTMLDRVGAAGRAAAQAQADLDQEWLKFGRHHWLWQLWQQMLRRAPRRR